MRGLKVPRGGDTSSSGAQRVEPQKSHPRVGFSRQSRLEPSLAASRHTAPASYSPTAPAAA